VVSASLEKLDGVLRRLLQKKSVVSLGISKDCILLGDEFVEKANPVCKTVAAALFERGIGTFIIKQPPSREEFQQILNLLATKREDILAKGGIESLWNQAEISSIDAIGIRYDRFSGTDDQYSGLSANQESVWEQLAKTVMQGESPVALSSMQAFRGEISPELLAEILNSRYIKGKDRSSSGLTTSLPRNTVKLMRDVMYNNKGHQQSSDYGGGSGSTAPSYQDGLLDFLRALDPRLRRQILDGFCEVGDDESSLVDEVVTSVGPALLQETYATAEEYSKAPPLLQGILRKLFPHSSEFFETVTPLEEVRKKVKTLLIEHDQESYLPEEYFTDLTSIISDIPLILLDKSEISALLKTIEPASIETRSSDIILQLVIRDTEGGNTEKLIENLTDMCVHFLELGDYEQVLKVLNQAADPAFPMETRAAMREAFTRSDFLEEILSGLTIWGKSRYDHVTLLIRIIGRPFIEPLLNRLADEDNMSLRRFMMDRIQSFGDAAIPSLVTRLSDNRWYVLRNIMIMLRTIAPGRQTEPLRALLKHSNSKVRNEAIKSLLMAGDQVAQRMVIRDLDSNDHETLLAAIHLSDKNCSDEVVKKLLALLTKGGYSQLEYEVKSATVQALSEIGRPKVLPELAKILGSRSLLAFKALNRLKMDIVKSLEKYPSAEVMPVLQRLARGSDDLSRQAAESIKSLRGRTT